MRVANRVSWMMCLMALGACGDGDPDQAPIEIVERERGDALEGRTFSFVQGDTLVTCDAGDGGCDELLHTLELGCVEEVGRWRFEERAVEGELECYDPDCMGDAALRDAIAQQVHLCLSHRLQTMASVPLAVDVCSDGTIAMRDRETMERYDPASGYTACGVVAFTVQPESAQDRLTLSMLATQQAMESVHRGRQLLDRGGSTGGGDGTVNLEDRFPSGESTYETGGCPAELPDCGGIGHTETITLAEIGVATLTETVEVLHDVGLGQLPGLANADAMVQAAAAEHERRTDAATRVQAALATQLVGYPRLADAVSRVQAPGDDDLLCDEIGDAGVATAELLERLGVQLDEPGATLAGVTVNAMREDLPDWIAQEGLEVADDEDVLAAAGIDLPQLEDARRYLLDRDRLVGVPVVPDAARPGREVRLSGGRSPVVAMANTIGRAQINHVHSVDEPLPGEPASQGYLACGGTSDWHYGRCGHLPEESLGAGGTVAAAMLEARGALARIVGNATAFSDSAAQLAVQSAASRGLGLVSQDVRGQARIATGKDLGDGADHLYVTVFGEKDVRLVWSEAGRVACSAAAGGTIGTDCDRYTATVTPEAAPTALEAGGHGEAVSVRVGSDAVSARCATEGCPHWTEDDVLYALAGGEVLFGVHPHPRPRVSYSPGGVYTKFRPPSLQTIIFGPGLIDALGQLLPDEDHCSRPAFVCGDRSAHVALESVIDENECGADDVDNAYECRLRAFERAAQESDAACMQVIESGLGLDARAESAREQLELACGGVVVDVWPGDEPPPACVSVEDCGEGAECFGGFCLGELPAEDQEALRACLGEAADDVRVDTALGTAPVCFFQAPGFDPCVCPEGVECPRACPVLVQGDCDRASFLQANELGDGWGLGYEFRASDRELGLVGATSNEQDAAVTIRSCRGLLHDVRTAEGNERAAAAEQAAAWARGINFRAMARQVGYEAHLHHLGRVTRDGGLWMHSGSVEEGLPHAADERTLCAGPGEPVNPGQMRLMSRLYDARYDCSDPVERFRMNTRLYRGVAALHAIGSSGGAADNVTDWRTSVRHNFGHHVVRDGLYQRVLVHHVPAARRFTVSCGEGCETTLVPRELAWPADPELANVLVGALVEIPEWGGVPDADFDAPWFHQPPVGPGAWARALPDWLTDELGTVQSGVASYASTQGLVHQVDGGDPAALSRRALEVMGLTPMFGRAVSARPGTLVDPPDFFGRARQGAPRGGAHVATPSLESILRDHATDPTYFEGWVLDGDVLFMPDLLDALELTCELGSPPDDGHDLDVAPVVETLADLPVAAAYIGHRASQLQRSISARALFGLPVHVARDLAARERTPEGAYGAELAQVRTALVDLARSERQLLDEVRSARVTVERASTAIRMEEAQRDVSEYVRAAEHIRQNLDCTLAVLRSLTISWDIGRQVVSAGATCTATGTLAINTSLRGEAEDRRTALAIELALIDAGDRLAAHAENMTRAVESMELALEQIGRGVEGLRRNRQQARVAFSRMLLAGSDASGRQHAVNTVMRARHGRLQRACERAHDRAKSLGWEARRTIEQHFAVNLADRELWNRTGDLGLLEAPPEWADALCAMNPVDYRHLRETGDFAASNPSGIVTGLADGFVGDYARLLRDFTRGYRGAIGLGDGRASAAIALADHVFESAGICAADSPNLFAWSARLGELATEDDAGWFPVCADPETSCAAVWPIDDVPYLVESGEVGAPLGHSVAYQLASDPAGAWGNATTEPVRGRFWLSWYERDDTAERTDPESHLVVAVASDSGTASAGGATDVSDAFTAPGWHRHAVVLDVPVEEVVEVHFALEAGHETRALAAVQLERLVDVASPRRFVATDGALRGPAQERFGCPDVDAERFRADHVDYVCGWDGRCFHEITFDLNDADLQGRLRQAGVHPGFYNYRLHSVAVNLVQRDQLLACEEGGWSCYARDRYPYELRHDASTVRDHEGGQYRVPLAPMTVVADASVGSYVRDERDGELVFHADLRGRPVQGQWRIRIEDDGRFDVGELRDVQLLAQYTYWNAD